MFEIIAGQPPAMFKPETQRAVIEASIKCVSSELRFMPAVLPIMTAVQRNRIKLALCEAVHAVNDFEQQLEAVQRVVEAERAGVPS